MKIVYFSIFFFSYLIISCTERQDTVAVGPHPSNWNNPNSQQFHGAVVIEGGAGGCTSCHGSNFQGGSSGVSCYTCHGSYPHPGDYLAPESPNFHGNYLRTAGNWNLQECQECHGSKYSGANTGLSCKTSGCHINPDGPEACNTCHGSFAGDVTDIESWAPPRGLNKEMTSSDPAVGAHQAHLIYYNYLAGVTACQECHVVPQNYGDPGHIDESPGAEVIFNGTLAVTVTEGGNRVPIPNYNPASNSCSAVYCHGNWGLLKVQSTNKSGYAEDIMEGNSAAPNWIDANSAACGSCHGLPPTGHIGKDLSECANCHGDVVDGSGNIIDNAEHDNGQVNVFGAEYPMF